MLLPLQQDNELMGRNSFKLTNNTIIQSYLGTHYLELQVTNP